MSLNKSPLAMSSRRPAPITEEQSCITDWKNHFQCYAKHVGVVEMPPPPPHKHATMFKSLDRFLTLCMKLAEVSSKLISPYHRYVQCIHLLHSRQNPRASRITYNHSSNHSVEPLILMSMAWTLKWFTHLFKIFYFRLGESSVPWATRWIPGERFSMG